MLIQFTQKKFKADHEITIGVEFGARNISIRGDERVYRVQIWDTAGQETFKSITRSYYKNSACAFVVYDVTKRESFNNISSWLADCRSHAPKTTVLVLIGNKIDLINDREVSTEEGEAFASKNNMMFFECSAKTALNIDNCFSDSVKHISGKIDNGFYDLDSEVG